MDEKQKFWIERLEHKLKIILLYVTWGKKHGEKTLRFLWNEEHDYETGFPLFGCDEVNDIGMQKALKDILFKSMIYYTIDNQGITIKL